MDSSALWRNQTRRTSHAEEAEPLVIAFKREVAKMRDRDASDLEIQAMLEFVEQSIRWREELNNREPLVCALREAAGLPH